MAPEPDRPPGPAEGWTAGMLARAIGGTLVGRKDRPLDGVRPLEEAGERELSFLGDARYRERAVGSAAGVILCAADSGLGERDRIEVTHPHLALAEAIRCFHPEARPQPGVHDRAVVGRGCQLGSDVHIGPLAVLGDGCHLGPRVVLHPGAVLGDGVIIGEDSVVHPNVVIYRGCTLGARVIVHAGSVIGADGFGYAYHDGAHRKIPHVGTVSVEDDVEIGAGVTIDRGTLGATCIGAGTKIDDQVMVAHNVIVGPGSLLVAQSGVAGSARLGRGVVLAGQSGIAGHLVVGDGAQIAAKSAVLQDLAAKTTVAGIPALPLSVWRRAQAAFARLPDLVRRVRRLEGIHGEDDEGDPTR